MSMKAGFRVLHLEVSTPAFSLLRTLAGTLPGQTVETLVSQILEETATGYAAGIIAGKMGKNPVAVKIAAITVIHANLEEEQEALERFAESVAKAKAAETVKEPVEAGETAGVPGAEG